MPVHRRQLALFAICGRSVAQGRVGRHWSLLSLLLTSLNNNTPETVVLVNLRYPTRPHQRLLQTWKVRVMAFLRLSNLRVSEVRQILVYLLLFDDWFQESRDSIVDMGISLLGTRRCVINHLREFFLGNETFFCDETKEDIQSCLVVFELEKY